MSEVTEQGYRLRLETLPYRLQNTSSMISLLADFYELTKNKKYLSYAEGLAGWLMELQADDGSYRRNDNTHYTCIIYPAKSMLELSIAEKEAGLFEISGVHFNSAKRAIENLADLLDDIQTEGEMTFEDGMISCESLQLGFMALLLPEGSEKDKLKDAAEYVLKKHFCLEQQILPDCRVRGCTLRYWEARYDLNFFSNMLNSLHGWTSWKTYATYYLYFLTGKVSYLKDTMDTIGACMQCVDEKGVLRWGFVVDPYIRGMNLKKGCKKGNVQLEETLIGEEYLPLISDWFRQEEGKLKLQYLPLDSSKWDEMYGGSCDNDVHEHFKCLAETVFGRAFVHQTAQGYLTYNCSMVGNSFNSKDIYLKQWIVYSLEEKKIIIDNKEVLLKKGFNFIKNNPNREIYILAK